MLLAGGICRYCTASNGAGDGRFILPITPLCAILNFDMWHTHACVNKQCELATQVVTELVKRGASLIMYDNKRNNPLHMAYRSGNELVIRYMLARGGMVRSTVVSLYRLCPSSCLAAPPRDHFWAAQHMPGVAALSAGAVLANPPRRPWPTPRTRTTGGRPTWNRIR